MYTLPKRYRTPAAVESNEARSPSRAGQHPHVVSDDRNYNPQQMYEVQRMPPRRALGAPQPPPAQQGEDFWGPLLIGGGLLALAYAMMKGDGPRQNPAEEVVSTTETVQQPAQQPVVVVVPTTAPMSLPLNTQIPQIAQAPKVEMQPPVVQTVDASKAVDAIVVEDKASKPRQRKTTQARDEKGHYLPAGTRKRAVTEGKG